MRHGDNLGAKLMVLPGASFIVVAASGKTRKRTQKDVIEVRTISFCYRDIVRERRSRRGCAAAKA
jgi:hypothetical protein